MKKKIVWLVYWPNTIYTDIANELSNYFDLHFVYCSIFKNYNFKKSNYNIIFLDYNSNYFSFLYKYNLKKDLPFILNFKDLNKTFDTLKPDLIISNIFYMPASFQAAKYCKKNNIPFILQTEIKKIPSDIIKNIITRILLVYAREMFNQAKYILPWTNQGVVFGKKHFGINNKNKIKILPAGLNTQLFKPILKKTNKRIRLLCIARMVPYKNHIFLLESFYKVLKIRKDISLTLLGQGPLKEEIIKKINNLGLKDYVKLLEYIPYQKMPLIYARHDVLILPSFNESIGMVVPEAMAQGLPVIVSDTVGAELYIQNNMNGYIFKTNDIDDLKNKILLMTDKQKICQFGLNAQKHIKENYDVKIIAKQFKKIISDAL
jgi:glycosyltransferase involved in cell wall biosynthesis